MLYGVKMVGRPVDGFSENGRVFDDEMVSVTGSYQKSAKKKIEDKPCLPGMIL